jgi:thiamine pyrophosphokinase
MGWVPDVVIGDADSLDEETSRWLQKHNIPLVRHPREKDETDLELALIYAVEAGAKRIFIVGAWGGRPDQSLANLQLLAHPALTGRHAYLLGPGYRLFLLRAGETQPIEGTIGDTVSLLPLTGEACGIHTSGLRWGLAGDTLEYGSARGVSNEMIASTAKVHLQEGLLLIVHLFDPTAEQALSLS